MGNREGRLNEKHLGFYVMFYIESKRRSFDNTNLKIKKIIKKLLWSLWRLEPWTGPWKATCPVCKPPR